MKHCIGEYMDTFMYVGIEELDPRNNENREETQNEIQLG